MAPPGAPSKPAATVRAAKAALLAREAAALRRVVGAERKATLAGRVRFAGIVRRHLRGVGPCLKRVEYAVSSRKRAPRMALMRGGEPAVIFGAQLGAGVYGEAFANAGARGAARLLRFGAKVTSAGNAEEAAALEEMSRLAEEGLCPNMPITFAALRCRDHCREQGCPDVARDRQYMVLLNELADGDLFRLFGAATLTRPQYESVLMQCLLALRAFQGLGLMHNDAHPGNFLFHRVPPGGYWRYDVPSGAGGGTVPLFVPNRGHLVVLWDPGMARPLQGPRAEFGSLEGAGDYFRAVNTFAALHKVRGEGGRPLKGPAPEAAARMNLGALLSEMHALLDREREAAEPLGHRLFRLVVRGVQEGRWLTSVRVGSRRRLPVRRLSAGRGEAGKVRTPGGANTLLRTRTLAPSGLPAGSRILNTKAFRVERAAPQITLRVKPKAKGKDKTKSSSSSLSAMQRFFGDMGME